MHGQSPPLDEIHHSFFEQDNSSPRLFPEHYLSPLPDFFENGIKPRDRIDSEEFEDRSFIPPMKQVQDAHCQTNPKDLELPPQPKKIRKPRGNVFEKLLNSSDKILFPVLGAGKRRTNRIGRKVARVPKMTRTGVKRRMSGQQSPKGTARAKSVRSPCRVPRPRAAPTLESIGSYSGFDGKGSQNTCSSVSLAQRPSFEQKISVPKGNEKLTSKISKLRTFWQQKNRIQPQIFRFLVYDFDTRKPSFEFVDHSLKGILVDQSGESPKEYGGAEVEMSTDDHELCDRRNGRGRFQFQD